MVVTYDGVMAKPKRIELRAVLADAEAVFERVERGGETLSVMRGETAIAVISPAPVSETFADLHRGSHEEPLNTTRLLEIIETRRLLSL